MPQLYPAFHDEVGVNSLDQVCMEEELAKTNIKDMYSELKAAQQQLELYDVGRRIRESDYVCKLCSDINLDGLMKPSTISNIPGLRRPINNNDGGFAHYASWQELKSSSLDGCKVCMLLWCALTQGSNGEDRYKSSLCPNPRINPTPETSAIYLRANNYSGQVREMELYSGRWISPRARIGLLAEEGWKAAEIVSTRPTSTDPLSATAISMLKNRLRECIDSHDECASNKQSKLPTRVIDVGDPDGSQNPRLLTDPNYNDAYVTLSHSWGGEVPLKTTRATIESHRRGISFRSLPRTFRDAVTVTRILGYRYLWIDSLCIIQDNTDDWTQQAAVMGNIYKDSILTISAMSAANGKEGFLIKKDPNATLSCVVNAGGKGKEEEGKMMFTFPAPYDGPDIIGSRAWVLQELLLPPRVVHYTIAEYGAERKMIWECQHGRIEEDGTVIDGGGSMYSVHTKGMLYQYDKTNLEDTYNIHDDNVYNKWRQVVSQYTARNLTVATDKLPALSGIAAEFLNRTKDHYLAGMWKGDLCRELLWVPWGLTKLQRPSSTRAPTWSWASADGRICYDHVLSEDLTAQNEDDYQIEILDTVVEPDVGNPFGRVKEGGFIRVSGRLRMTMINIHERPGKDLTYDFSPESPVIPQYSISDEDAEGIWSVIDSIMAIPYQDPGILDPLGPDFLMNQLTKRVQSVLEVFSRQERTSAGLESQLNKVLSYEDCYHLGYCNLAIAKIHLWISRNGCQAIRSRSSYKIGAGKTTVIKLLAEYVRLYNILQEERQAAMEEYKKDVTCHAQDIEYLQMESAAPIRQPDGDDTPDEPTCIPYQFQPGSSTEPESEHRRASLGGSSNQAISNLQPPKVSLPNDAFQLRLRTPTSLEKPPKVTPKPQPRQRAKGRVRFDSGDPNKVRDIWCLQIRKGKWSGGSLRQHVPHGLALIPTEAEETYMRVGTFALDDWETAENLWFDGIEKRVITVI